MTSSYSDLDVICIGRSSVDLYGTQTGGRLEDMAGFDKYVGGSPTNISIGAARLGLKSALITRVGDEHMGRFITEQLTREGVDISHTLVDPDRLTALVLLGIRNSEQFPLIFVRENCADMALHKDDIDAAFIASAKAVVVTGTHFSTPQVAEASTYAMQCARSAGRKVAFDIDYRPNLWALGGHGDGEDRFRESAFVTAHLQNILPLCDLVVGTEEEWHIAGGSTDTLAALRTARSLSDAVFVCKRGAMGCVVFEDVITDWDSGISSPVREIEVYNVLGAGDGFMAGFLRGWLRDEGLEVAARYANTCGALAVSRHGCAPSYPSYPELRHLLDKGSDYFALRKDPVLNQLHWSTLRRVRHDKLFAFAFDHRQQFEDLASRTGRDTAAIGRFKALAYDAVQMVTASQDGVGLLVDDELGQAALHRSADSGLWTGRPVEASGVYPLALNMGPDIGTHLAEWPVTQTVKLLLPYRLDDPADIRRHHDQLLARLYDACRTAGRELLVEIITSHSGQPVAADDIPVIMDQIYQQGIYPDWWKLEPVDGAGFWQACGDLVRRYDPYAQGIIVLGKQMPADQLTAMFAAAKREAMVNGFAIGRTIFWGPAEDWFAGRSDDETATRQMAAAFAGLIDAWQNA